MIESDERGTISNLEFRLKVFQIELFSNSYFKNLKWHKLFLLNAQWISLSKADLCSWLIFWDVFGSIVVASARSSSIIRLKSTLNFEQLSNHIDLSVLWITECKTTHCKLLYGCGSVSFGKKKINKTNTEDPFSVWNRRPTLYAQSWMKCLVCSCLLVD